MIASRTLLATLIVAAAPACAPAARAAGAVELCPTLMPAAEPVAVAEVLAGDTFRLTDGTVVRLAAVAVPSQPLSADDTAPAAGQRASVGLRAVLGGQAVFLSHTGEGADRHGRVHAYVFRADGQLVQAALVRAGWALARWLPGEAACLPALLAAEAEARKAGRGLWNGPDYAIWAADDSSLADRTGLYELVEGRVLSVGKGSRMIFLDFGRNYRQDFTIMVAPPVAEALGEQGHALDNLVNRRVRVRGVIEESGGPAIRLNHPAEIELID